MSHAFGRAKLIWYFFVPAKLFPKNPLQYRQDAGSATEMASFTAFGFFRHLRKALCKGNTL